MAEPTILILNKLSARHRAVIENAAPGCKVLSCEWSEAAAKLPDADVLAAWGWMDIEPLLANGHNLKWIHALSAGVENLLFPVQKQTEILLTNSKGIHSIPVSEHVMALLLSFSRGLNMFIRHQQKHLWQRSPVEELHGKTMAIIGLGSIGREIAKKAKCFGMQVIASKQTLTRELFVDRLFGSDGLDEMLACADFVVASLPLLPETQGMFSLERFRRMKPSAYFINISRGPVVNEADLAAALEQGLIKGAGLDVFAEEPLAATSPLWDMENVIITPHLAALSPNYMERATRLFAENLERYLSGKDLVNLVDRVKGY